MHVCVLGAGALGRVFGVRLARVANVDVDFVVRPSRLGDGPLRVEHVEGESHALDAPSRVTAIPAHADVVLVCVAVPQLDEALAMLKAGPDVPAVTMTPMLPHTYARARAAIGARAVAAISSVTGYVNERGVARYWLSRAAKTTIDEARPVDPALNALIGALTSAGIESRLELGVHETSPATALLFAPLSIALDVAGTVDALFADATLLEVAFDASDEARALADRVGKVAVWTSLLTRFVSPLTLKMAVGLARRRSPEAVTFAEAKFGRGARAQNVAVAEEIVALAIEKQTPHAALDDLLARLKRA